MNKNFYFVIIPLAIGALAMIYLQIDGRPLKLIFLDNYLHWVVGITGIKTPKDAIRFQSENYAMDKIDGIDSIAGRYADVNHTLQSGVKLPVRIYYPNGYDPQRKRPYNAFVWIHGGGWIFGRYSDNDLLLTGLTNSSDNIVAFSVEYRLAPEYKFPTGLNDCWHHLIYISEHAKDFNIDPNKIVIGGEDVGGNFVAVLSQRSRKDRHVHLAGQYLCSPILMDPNGTESERKYRSGYILTPTFLNVSFTSYATTAERKLAEVFPFLAKKLTGLPPVLLHITEFDQNNDYTMKYANRLIDAGIPVKIHKFAGVPHGAIAALSHSFPDVAKTASLDLAEWLKSLWPIDLTSQV
jgi:acetyl esterase